jgi:beta-glucosidase
MRENKRWVWATGFENTFIGQTERQERPLDEYELTQHYRFWKEDLALARASGVSMIRYGIPWYKVEPEPGVFDWTWVDEVMEEFKKHPGMTPIIDLMHYGTPLWMKNEFMNARYPECVARYAAAFAERYKSIVKHYTPLNEPYVNAEWCGWSGIWPPYLKGHLGFMLIMNRLCKGIILTIESIRAIQPEAIFVHVEASKLFVAADPSVAVETKLWNEIRNVMWEMIQGRIDQDHPLYDWVISHGVSEADLNWYSKHAVEPDYIGINYYPQFSVNEITKEVMEYERIPHALEGTGNHLVEIAEDMYRRYNKPIFITETSFKGTPEERVAWMEQLFEACREMEDRGIDLYGITWFPFMDMVDWPYRTNTSPLENNMATFGLYSLHQQPDGTLKRVKNAAAVRFEQEIQAKLMNKGE